VARLFGRHSRLFGGVPGLFGGEAGALRRVAGLFGSLASHFAGVPRLLPLLPDLFERFTMLLVDLTPFFGEAPEVFRNRPRRIIRCAALFRQTAVALAKPTLAFGLFPCALRVGRPLLASRIVTRHHEPC
jgi:hypothetical protein